ncbi:hypothetical protein B0J12DRAFT_27272 [Macrophomina phaseolina]|uniref:RanBD1 domain-containing protein n=1 Tax=Macrophomina phaseolina TaxID=35725 RepID=A0ABQ8GVB3_9PEZI|nr:hypothetical protein B0J12DRAFT_27272 [Macrophomina phaseolina]
MSKRGATQQLSKEGTFFGDGSNDLSGDDKPRKATAAQLANRKLKPLKGRPRVAGSTTAQSFPPASQPSSNAFTGFAPTPPSGGFNFSAGPASNPFASQNTGSNSSGGTNFSSSFTFGSNNNASNPFGGIAPAASAGNAFGSTPSSTPSNDLSSNNIFAAASPAPTNNMFGANNTSSAQTSNLFGASSSAQPNAFTSNSGSTNNIFAASSPAPSGNVFGATSSAASSTSNSAASTNPFGAATSTPSSTNLFGNTTPTTTSGTSSQPSSNNFFATTSSSAPSGALFGGTNTSTAPSSTFGGSTSGPSNNTFSGVTTSSAPSNMFSSSTTSTAPANLFGNPINSPAPSKDAFSSTTTSSTPSNLFSTAVTSSSTPSSNMFSNAATSAPGMNLFGNPTTSSSTPTTGAPATSGASGSIFGGLAQQPGSSGPSQPANIFAQSTSASAPASKSGIFNFGAQPSANATGASNESAPATSGPSQSSTSNMFSQSISGFQAPSGGANMFGFSTRSPSTPAAGTAEAAGPVTTTDKSDTGDSQPKLSNNLFAQSHSSASPQIGSNLFGSTMQSSSRTSQSGVSTTGTNAFGFPGQNTTQSADSKTQDDTQKNKNSQSSSTANLFAQAASGGADQLSGLHRSGQTSTLDQDRPAAATSSANPFSTIAPSSSSLASSAASMTNTNGASSSQQSAGAKVDSIAKPAASAAQPADTVANTSADGSLDTSKADAQRVEMFRSLRTLNAWFKLRISEAPEDRSFAQLAKVYLSQYNELTGSTSHDDQAQSKSSGKRKADDNPDVNGVNGAGSPKKSKSQPSQSDSAAAGASNTANIFNSIANKSAQSPLRNVESATPPDAEAGPSGNNIFGASSSSPFKFGAGGGISGSTTPAGSPAKPSAFSQSPIKPPVFGQADTSTPSDSKRKSVDISSDEQDEESQDDTAQREKRQKTSPSASAADTGSVLNSRQASPDARNPFGHLSQDEGRNDEDDASDDEENGEQGSTTPKAAPKNDGLFGRITKDATTAGSGPQAPEESGLFGRITATSADSSKSATTNPFGFPAASYEAPGGAKAGPVLKTWNGDAGSPIKFGSSPSSQTDNGKKDGTSSSSSSNPFAGIATSSSSAPSAIFKFASASTPPSDSSPFKFNPVAATPSGGGSVLGSGLGSRATTPGLSTGASENENSAAENEDDEETQTVDKEQIALRTALTEEDKKTYEVLFDTDIRPVTMVRVVKKTEEEMKANPKGTTKFEAQGKGPLRILKHKESGAASLLLKSEPMGRVLINSRLLPKFDYKRQKAKFALLPFTDAKGAIAQTYLKFEDDDECTKFVEVCKEHQPTSG